MERPQRRNLPALALNSGLALALILPALDGVARAQSAPTDVAPSTDNARIDRLEQMLQSVVDENRRLSEEVRALKGQLSLPTPAVPPPALPSDPPAAPQPDPGKPFYPQETQVPAGWWLPPAAPQPDSRSLLQKYTVGYDNGFVILPENLDDSPFSLKFNNQTQFRYTAFERGASSWTDSAGNVNPISSSSSFQIPRGRLIFSGKALLPNLSYLLNIDYNTVTSNPIGFRAYSLSYRFSRALELSVGQTKVPGSREWLTSASVAQEGPDRSMATTFFRPSLSQGIWITGEPIDRVSYHMMLSNGFNTLNLTPNQLFEEFCWSGAASWEPWGAFGPGYPDIEGHEDPAIRLGSRYTFALGAGSQANSDAVENSAIRLSDGTLITQPGAFAPGVTLQRYDISLAAIDMAYKYRGFSVSSELYFQDLLGLKGNGPLPLSSTQAFGGFLQGGYFVIPQKVELYARTSYVTGHYGSGTELAGGFNWFPLKGKSNLRFTFDATWLDHSPADQNRTGFVAGQTGVLIRTQISTLF